MAKKSSNANRKRKNQKANKPKQTKADELATANSTTASSSSASSIAESNAQSVATDASATAEQIAVKDQPGKAKPETEDPPQGLPTVSELTPASHGPHSDEHDSSVEVDASTHKAIVTNGDDGTTDSRGEASEPVSESKAEKTEEAKGSTVAEPKVEALKPASAETAPADTPKIEGTQDNGASKPQASSDLNEPQISAPKEEPTPAAKTEVEPSVAAAPVPAVTEAPVKQAELPVATPAKLEAKESAPVESTKEATVSDIKKEAAPVQDKKSPESELQTESTPATVEKAAVESKEAAPVAEKKAPVAEVQKASSEKPASVQKDGASEEAKTLTESGDDASKASAEGVKKGAAAAPAKDKEAKEKPQPRQIAQLSRNKTLSKRGSQIFGMFKKDKESKTKLIADKKPTSEKKSSADKEAKRKPWQFWK